MTGWHINDRGWLVIGTITACLFLIGCNWIGEVLW